MNQAPTDRPVGEIRHGEHENGKDGLLKASINVSLLFFLAPYPMLDEYDLLPDLVNP